jgi:hypothetical protein
VLFVPKPRNPSELYMCIDFRRLNLVTKRDFHTIPDMQDLYRQMVQCKYFTALDLTRRFWNLPIVLEHQNKTAFTGPDGEIYVWNRAPMLLVNSPAACQRLMAHVLQSIPQINVCIDNITIYTRTRPWQNIFLLKLNSEMRLCCG